MPDICPRLGLSDDPTLIRSQANAAHRCFAVIPPGTPTPGLPGRVLLAGEPRPMSAFRSRVDRAAARPSRAEAPTAGLGCCPGCCLASHWRPSSPYWAGPVAATLASPAGNAAQAAAVIEAPAPTAATSPAGIGGGARTHEIGDGTARRPPSRTAGCWRSRLGPAIRAGGRARRRSGNSAIPTSTPVSTRARRSSQRCGSNSTASHAARRSGRRPSC